VSGAPVPAKIADVLRKLPHIAVASPAIQQMSTQTAVETIWGIDYPSFNALRPFKFLSGGPFQGPNDVMVDDLFARSGKGYHVGDMIPVINGHEFRICGIFEHGKGGRKFLPIRTLGALLEAENNATLFYVKADKPENEDLIKQEIHATPGLSQYGVQTLQEVLGMVSISHCTS
jgi:putative ABC transport system permease protein